MKPRSSGTIDAGVSKKTPAPSGSIVIAPSELKNVAICCCAANANGAPGPTMFVKNVCGFALVPKAGRARSFRNSVARLEQPQARRIADVVGFGTVLSPRANWKITGRVRYGEYAAGLA